MEGTHACLLDKYVPLGVIESHRKSLTILYKLHASQELPELSSVDLVRRILLVLSTSLTSTVLPPLLLQDSLSSI